VELRFKGEATREKDQGAEAGRAAAHRHSVAAEKASTPGVLQGKFKGQLQRKRESCTIRCPWRSAHRADQFDYRT